MASGHFQVGPRGSLQTTNHGPVGDTARHGALRNPATSEWVAFPPNVLLFGEVADAMRYSCFSRIIAALFNLTCGIPHIGYFDDFGALRPYGLPRDAVDTSV